jgi:hypothetical protein
VFPDNDFTTSTTGYRTYNTGLSSGATTDTSRIYMTAQGIMIGDAAAKSAAIAAGNAGNSSQAAGLVDMAKDIGQSDLLAYRPT